MNTLQVIFTTVLNMSITASFVAIGVMIVRLMLKKMPKIFSYVLWLAVLIRLVFPVSFTSAFSFLSVIKPGTQHITRAFACVPYNMGLMQTPGIDVGVNSINKAVNSSLPQAVQTASVNPMQIVMAILSMVWVVGVALLIVYSVVSYLKVINNVKTSTLLRDEIFETDRIVTPFVCGFQIQTRLLNKVAHENEYNAILAMDHKALTYLFSEFKKGGQNGLKGQIMMNLCRTILGGEDIKSAITTPQDWYDTYKDHIQKMVNENGIDWVHQNAPKGSLIRA